MTSEQHSAMGNQESATGGSKGSGRNERKHLTESSLVLNKFGYSKKTSSGNNAGRPADVLFNSSNIYEALIDQNSEEDSKHYQAFIPSLHDFSAIGGVNVSSSQMEAQITKYKEMSSKLGVATPLFVPKPAGSGINTSKSQLLELLANAS